MSAVVAISVALAALAGVLLAPITGVHPAMGSEILTAAFVVVVIGGLGSFWGVVYAALIVGVVRGLTVYFYPAGGGSVDVPADGARAAGAPARAVRRADTSASNESRACVLPLVIAALGALVLPFILLAAGLTLTSATDVVIFAIACMALNMLVGYTGLVSFGHGAWFGLGAYAAALAQRYWFPGSVLWPALFALAFLRRRRRADRLSRAATARRLFFAADARVHRRSRSAIAYRWTAFTGGESGLGGVTRARWLGVDLENRVDLLHAGRADRRRCRRRAAAVPSLADRHRCSSRSARTSSARSSSAIRPSATSRSRSRSRRRCTGFAGVLFGVPSSLRVGRPDRRRRSPASCSRW